MHAAQRSAVPTVGNITLDKSAGHSSRGKIFGIKDWRKKTSLIFKPLWLEKKDSS